MTEPTQQPAPTPQQPAQKYYTRPAQAVFQALKQWAEQHTENPSASDVTMELSATINGRSFTASIFPNGDDCVVTINDPTIAPIVFDGIIRAVEASPTAAQTRKNRKQLTMALATLGIIVFIALAVTIGSTVAQKRHEEQVSDSYGRCLRQEMVGGDPSKCTEWFFENY
ncbi:hypothetical protein [Bifidobacterium eulemuris]|uniref:Uncharacterized protein n=1 Tax=Bifidobacterium eulemuris TaxID=1765219 RepID=A0A261G9U6_9BIFI|nr:hypothetical protein [Bifidobacterium eulemuris]OZG68202.1 hypothetical protein BEUL_1215 [Bifidobacterium eulemuris]QOL31741.1 hypothetical protein BE0216_04115 [Bifidobacterium eulemuris]